MLDELAKEWRGVKNVVDVICESLLWPLSSARRGSRTGCCPRTRRASLRPSGSSTAAPRSRRYPLRQSLPSNLCDAYEVLNLNFINIVSIKFYFDPNTIIPQFFKNKIRLPKMPEVIPHVSSNHVVAFLVRHDHSRWEVGVARPLRPLDPIQLSSVPTCRES